MGTSAVKRRAANVRIRYRKTDFGSRFPLCLTKKKKLLNIVGESKEMINKSKNTEAIQSAVNKRRKCRSFPTKKRSFFPHLKRENKYVEPILPVSLSQHLIWPDLLAVLEIKRPGHLNKSLEVQPDLFFYFLFCIKREKLNPNFLYQTSPRSIGFTDTHQRSRE